LRVLLDTHTLLWFTLGDTQLSATALGLISDPSHDKLVSPATYWESAIKVSIGKLTLHQAYPDFIDRAIPQNGFDILPIEPRYAAVVVGPPFHHKDPFDQMLIAQALAEGIPVVSCDGALDPYGISRLW
jgi:PIN domain nuclease of toxin-antitoxin system